MKPHNQNTQKRSNTTGSHGISVAVAIRFAIIGLLWVGVCGWFISRLLASGQPITLLSIFPLLVSGIVVFVPLYKKYVRNESKQ